MECICKTEHCLVSTVMYSYVYGYLFTYLYYFRLRKYEIMMVLDHGQFYSVSLCKEKSSIQLDVIVEKNAQSSAESRKQLVDFFQTMLEQTCQVFMPASAKPNACTPCPHCNELHIRYKKLLEEHPQLCGINSVHSDYYQDFFKDTQGTLDS